MKNDKEKFKNNLANKNTAFQRVFAGLSLTQLVRACQQLYDSTKFNFLSIA